MSDLLKPFSIGNVRSEFNVVLAALAGYSDLAFRSVCRDLGAPLCMTEMMLDRSLLTRGKLQTRLVVTGEQDHPVVAQIVGNDPHTVADAARVLDERGFDAIDLNFACPVNKALKRRRGGYLMSQPDLAVEITRAVVQAVNRPVTLKIRRRFALSDDDSSFHRIVEGALEAGAVGFGVHARSVEQKYSGPADWDFLRDVRRRYPHTTLIGSGDVKTPQRALDMLAETGMDAVMAARGAMGNPWFFRQVQDLAAKRDPRPPGLPEQKEVILRHFQGAVKLYGQLKGASHMRKFGIKYARMHPASKRLRMAFVEVKNERQWREVLEKYYDNWPQEVPAP